MELDGCRCSAEVGVAPALEVPAGVADTVGCRYRATRSECDQGADVGACARRTGDRITCDAAGDRIEVGHPHSGAEAVRAKAPYIGGAWRD